MGRKIFPYTSKNCSPFGPLSGQMANSLQTMNRGYIFSNFLIWKKNIYLKVIMILSEIFQMSERRAQFNKFRNN